jgi:hypothetical protein
MVGNSALDTHHSFFDIRPGALVILEGVDFHPTFVDVHGIDVLLVVDELLEHVRERSLFERRRLMEGAATVAADDALVGLPQEFHAFGGEHGHADELAMGVL